MSTKQTTTGLALYGFEKELQDKINRTGQTGNMFNSFTFETTPEEFIKTREGSDGKMYDYIQQFYVIRVLNSRFFPWGVRPGWRFWFEPTVRTWVMTGDLWVTYPDALTNELKEREVPGIGSLFVHKKTNDPTEPVQPDDMARGTRTEFVKNAAYWLGIGFDVYSQEIPLILRDRFEEKIRNWVVTEPVLAVANKLKTKKAFEKYVNGLPTVEQTKEFISILGNIPKEKHYGLWDIFIRKNKSDVNSLLDEIKTRLGGPNGTK